MPYSDPEMQRAYVRTWIAARRADFFTGQSCARCGSTERLELDHVDPATKVTHRIWSWSRPRRDAELAKCQVLCRACHQDKTVLPLLAPATHGSTAYKASRCRCDECRTGAADYNRRWRELRGLRVQTDGS